MNIEWLKNKTKEKFYPITHAKAVLFGNSNKTLDEEISDINNSISSHTSNTSNPHSVTKAQVGLGNVEDKSSATIRGEITKSNITTALGYTPLNQSLKGSASGLAELDSNGKVPSSQLPSYVDDVIEGYLSGGKFYKESAHTTEISGETGKIYIDLHTGKTYRWSGSAFVVISETLALGETSSTAYRGDRGKTAYDHSQKTSGNPHGVTKSDVGLGNVENKSSETIRSEITSSNVTNALGYTPTKQSDIDNAVDDIEIGGRNLLLGSANPVNKFSWMSANGSSTKTEEDMLGVKGILLDVTTASTGWQFCNYNFGESRMKLIKPDTYYTLSFDVYPSADNEIDFFIANSDTANIVSSFSVNKKIVANQWNHISLTVKTYSTITISNQVIYIRGFNKVATYKICNFKFEEGNKATPWTPAIEDTEAEIQAVDKKVTTNLLKPTLATTTQNGVTCTNNGDGTYTLNGTASKDTYFRICESGKINKGVYKLVGCPSNGGFYNYFLYLQDININEHDYGNGIICNLDNDIDLSVNFVALSISNGIECNNLVFKPMITTNLNATYDDFVPYTGSTGQLNSDVAEINTELDKKADKEKYGDTIVSVGRKPNSTIGAGSFAFGEDVTANGDSSHAEGLYTTATGEGSHAEGNDTTASGSYSHAEGHQNTASAYVSHVEGSQNTASGFNSHAEGNSNTASGYASHAEGYSTTALDNQHAQGHFNNTTTAKDNSTSGTSTGTAFVIGNGTDSSPSNAYRVTGEGVIYATNAAVQTGADYAEYFEWSDGNPNNEDRVGLFVTFDEDNPEKIRIANSNDDYILGIVSGMPSVIGNGDEDWKKRYVLDDFGRYIQETFEYVENEETKTGTKWKENPEYDNTKPYAPRAERAEWSAIGLVGVLSVYDDGTCQVNGYCKCKNNGIATAVEKGVDTYRVIKRVNDNIVKVVLK